MDQNPNDDRDDANEVDAAAETEPDVEGFGFGKPALGSIGLADNFGGASSDPTLTINSGEGVPSLNAWNRLRDPHNRPNG